MGVYAFQELDNCKYEGVLDNGKNDRNLEIENIVKFVRRKEKTDTSN